MTRKEYVEFFKKVCSEMVAITEKKNHDYVGGGDDPFKNFRQIANLVGGTAGNSSGTGPIDIIAVGFLTRMSDKMSRIGTFVEKGELKVLDESAQDTLKDLAVYSILFLAYLEERKESGTNRLAASEATIDQ